MDRNGETYDSADDAPDFEMCQLCGDDIKSDPDGALDEIPALYRGQWLHGACARERFGLWVVPDADAVLKPGYRVSMRFWDGVAQVIEGTVDALCDYDGDLAFGIVENQNKVYLAESVTEINGKPISWVRECSSCLRPFGTRTLCERCGAYVYHVVPMEPVDSLIPTTDE